MLLSIVSEKSRNQSCGKGRDRDGIWICDSRWLRSSFRSRYRPAYRMSSLALDHWLMVLSPLDRPVRQTPYVTLVTLQSSRLCHQTNVSSRRQLQSHFTIQTDCFRNVRQHSLEVLWIRRCSQHELYTCLVGGVGRARHLPGERKLDLVRHK